MEDIVSARKASRASCSTSRAETLSAICRAQIGKLIAARFTELLCRIRTPSRKETIASRDVLQFLLKDRTASPHGAATDCLDLFELIAGGRGVPSDKSRRAAVMALREDRARNRCRSLLRVPTRVTMADGVARHTRWFDQWLLRCAAGQWMITLLENRTIRRSRASLHPGATENDIENFDE